ncbi:hypothetical protein [Streptomyces sp. SID5643]|uniref:hypothetical protein n=1 Tax=Streptomyces sp. SID5643 TaxID=2690307 RepID=UPI001367B0AD|nr:hypothetical protein [Streptomyces sp. SID5643]MZF88830.1 hypothetical protein [Streptomyces sp. SID5643]
MAMCSAVIMVMLDADAYGCAASALKGPLAERQRAALTRLLAVFDRVLPAIDDAYVSRYCTHLHKTAVLAAGVDDLRER